MNSMNYPLILTVLFLRMRRKVLIFLQEQEVACQDATCFITDTHAANTTATQTDVTVVSLDPPHPIDEQQMICDIRAIASRLASKAHQLLGV